MCTHTNDFGNKVKAFKNYFVYGLTTVTLNSNEKEKLGKLKNCYMYVLQ